MENGAAVLGDAGEGFAREPLFGGEANPHPVNAPEGSVLLELEKVTVQFGKFTAGKEATFSLRAGSLLGLIGPNGAGKTTLLRGIASLQPLTRGTIKVLGEKISPGDEEAARMI